MEIKESLQKNTDIQNFFAIKFAVFNMVVQSQVISLWFCFVLCFIVLLSYNYKFHTLKFTDRYNYAITCGNNLLSSFKACIGQFHVVFIVVSMYSDVELKQELFPFRTVARIIVVAITELSQSVRTKKSILS